MRNNFTLRSREDVPHYLRPLEKKATGIDAELLDRKDQFSGDRLQFLEQERFVWNLIENQKSTLVSSAALPTAAEMLYKEGKKAAEEKQKTLQNTIEEIYGKQGEVLAGESGQQVDKLGEEAEKWVEESWRKEWDSDKDEPKVKEIKEETKNSE